MEEEEEDVSSKFLAELKNKLKEIPSFGEKKHKDKELDISMNSINDVKA